jgi:internalin-related protein
MIVSGSNKYNLTVGTSWVGIQNYLADDNVMTIYGDITKFNCSGNGNNIYEVLNAAADTILTELICTDNNLSSLNISRNTQLRKLNCARNNIIALNYLANNVNLTSLDCSNNLLARLDVSANFLLEKIICHGNIISSNTRLLDIIYCLLPDRSVKTTGYIQPLYDDRSSDLDSVLATNSLNAFNKNWNVSYASDSTDISPTTGSYVCTEVDTTRYIYLEVKPNETLKLEFLVDNIDDIITIVSGKNSKTFRGNFSIGYSYDCTFTPDSTSMIIYGNVNELNCIGNGNKITALDISHNSGVTRLMCDTNNIAWLHLNGQELTFLTCSNNRLTSLDVSTCPYLTFLDCSYNQINDIKYLNTLSNLEVLICNDNRLTSLVVNSNNSALNSIACENNNFSSAQAFDDLFCSLPLVNYGRLSIIYDSLSNGYTELLASNKYNAMHKAWRVVYVSDENIPHTTGTYSCINAPLDTIVLGVRRGKYIKLRFASDYGHSQARVVSGSTDTIVQVDTVWTDTLRFMADADSMIIISSICNVNRFSCRDNGENILSIDIAKIPLLQELDCANNHIRGLRMIRNDYLTNLNCSNNQISDLYIDANLGILNCAHNQIETLFVKDLESSLEELDCSYNFLNKLDISNNDKITYLNCSGNDISVLSLSNNPYIKTLKCDRNNLDSLNLMANNLLESVDLSYNPQLCNLNISDTSALKRIALYGCNFSTCGLDSVFRALPRRLPADRAAIFVKDSAATNPGVDGCRDTIASHRNWAVLNFKGNNSMDTIKNSFYTCVPNMNLNRAISLNVVPGQTISLSIKAAIADTHIRFTCGSTDTILTVGTSWSYWQLPAKDDKMIFFGDITRFNCNTNGNNITAISTKTNTILEELQCIGNAISTLDLSHNVELSELYCLGNRLTSLDLSHNHKLTELACYDNPQLQHIDVNGCYPLSRVVVYGCNLSDCGLDSLLRALPRRSSDNKGKIFIKDGTSTNPGSGGCQDTIASHKNWVVLDYNGGSPDTIANTHYTCADTPTDNDRHLTNETDIKIYPNPVADILYLSATASTIHIYDIYGIEVARATDTDKVGVSHLPDGVYIVRADGTVAKMVKQ